MYSFGKSPPRSIHSPGVAGLLDADCTVFYDNLFGSLSLGRVTDVLVSRFREHGLDELRFRALLLFTYFEAYRGQGDGEPLVIECGFDGEKIAIGIAFSQEPGTSIGVDGLAERISETKPSSRLEELLCAIYRNADHCVLRTDGSGPKVEVVSLMAIPDKIDVPTKQPITVLVQQEPEGESIAEAQPKEYIQLADLDYEALLKEKSREKRQPEYSNGEILARSFKGDDQAEDPVVRISGSPAEEESKVVIRSESKDEFDTTKVRVGSGNASSLLKKIWPFRKGETAAKEESASEPTSSASAKAPNFEHGDARGMIDYLETGLNNGGFAAIGDRLQEKAKEIKAGKDSAFGNWLDRLAHDFSEEKLKFAEILKKTTLTLRQKEHELESRDRVFAEDIRKRDEQLHQANLALKRTKEQLSQTSAKVEHMKQTASTDSEGYKQKYQLSQKMIVALREERTLLSEKLSETKSRVLALEASKRSQENGAGSDGISELKAEQEILHRKYIQLKAANQQLLLRMKETSEKHATHKAESVKTVKTSGSGEELKRKLETATKLTTAQQKEIDRLRLRIEQSVQEEARLKADVNKLQYELRAAKIALGQNQKKAG